MKVIFLDNDGVICLSSNWGSRHKKQDKWGGKKLSMDITSIPVECRFDNFDKKAVKVLNQILETTGAEIVVSSDWRLHGTLEELGEYYTSQGIIKKPIGFTEVLHFEIKDYLKSHPEVTHWVAIDDLHMGIHVANSSYGPFDRDWGLEHFVWTPRDWEGIKQSGIKQKIIKHLSC